MTYKRLPFTLSLLLLLITANINAQQAALLQRGVPEEEGVSSKGIINFLDAAKKSKHEFHSLMIIRHNKVIAEGWWKPYRSDLHHTMYSVSKSFTSTAVGFAVSEKRLTVNDKVISFFPKDLPDTVSSYLSELTVKNLLTMSVGQEPDPTNTIPARESNWVKGFLSTSIINKPGSKFLYNTMATYMLSAIVQKVTGQKLIDYLTPRLFKPLGIQGMDWEVSPQAINTGGWGLRIKTEDMAKLGLLYLHKGKWNNKQLLPEAWVNEATSMKIEQEPNANQSKKDSSDWLQGYCYQFWRSRHNSFRGDGAFGQYILVLPEEDAVIAITAETPDMQGEINLVWENLLPAFNTGKLPASNEDQTILKQKLASLSLPLPNAGNNSAIISTVSDKTYMLEQNEENIKNLAFRFSGNVCKAIINTSKGKHEINFNSGNWHFGETTKDGPYLLAKAKAKFVGLPPFKVAGAYSWIDDKTLELTLRYIESPHTEILTCHFDGTNILVDVQNSFEKNKKITLKGQIKG